MSSRPAIKGHRQPRHSQRKRPGWQQRRASVAQVFRWATSARPAKRMGGRLSGSTVLARPLLTPAIRTACRSARQAGRRPIRKARARPAYEVNVLDDRAGHPVMGYIVFVDARTGETLFRHNAVDQAALGMALAPHSDFFTGDYPFDPSGVWSAAQPSGGRSEPDTRRDRLSGQRHQRHPVDREGPKQRRAGNPRQHRHGSIPEAVVVNLANTGADAGTWTVLKYVSRPTPSPIPSSHHVRQFILGRRSGAARAEVFRSPASVELLHRQPPALPDGPFSPWSKLQLPGDRQQDERMLDASSCSG